MNVVSYNFYHFNDFFLFRSLIIECQWPLVFLYKYITGYHSTVFSVWSFHYFVFQQFDGYSSKRSEKFLSSSCYGLLFFNFFSGNTKWRFLKHKMECMCCS